jgi:hypothetical protein
VSLLEALIPGVIGAILAVRPETMFVGARVVPTVAKLAMLRRLGWLLLAIAALFVVLALIEG